MTRNILALIAFLDARASAPYQWGSSANDCASFVNGAVKAQTGMGALGKLRWSNKAGALRTLKRVGGLEAALDAKFERILVAHASRGDIAGVPVARMLGLDLEEAALVGIHPMIVEGATLVSPGERGLKRAPRNIATIAWSVTARKRKR